MSCTVIDLSLESVSLTYESRQAESLEAVPPGWLGQWYRVGIMGGFVAAIVGRQVLLIMPAISLVASAARST